MTNVRVQTTEAVWPLTASPDVLDIQEDGSTLPARGALNFAEGIVATDDPANNRINITTPSTVVPADYQTRAEKGAPNGYAALDATGLVPASQLPILSGGGGSSTIVSAKALGAVGDGKSTADAVMSVGSNILTSATAGFTQADVGKIVVVFGAGASAGSLGATITSVINTTTVTLSASAGTAVSAAQFCWGTDDGAKLQLVSDSLSATGGGVEFPPGIYMTSSRIIVPACVQWRGTAIDYSNSAGVSGGNLTGSNPTRGTVIKAGGTFNSANALVRFGTVQVTYGSGNTSPSAQWMAFDGAYLAQSGLQTWAARTFLAYCWIGQGQLYALDMSGQNSRCFGCVTEGGSRQGVSTVLMNANDTKYWQGEIRNGGKAMVEVTGTCGNFWIGGNDIFGTSQSTSPTSHCVYITAATQGNGPITCSGMIVGNNVDAGRGDQLKIAPAANVKVGGITFQNNRGYAGGPWPASQYSIVNVDLSNAGSECRGLTISNNTYDIALGNGRWKALVSRPNTTGAVDQWVVRGNVIRGVDQPFVNVTPTDHSGNVWSRVTTGGEANNHVSTARGTATFSGDGTTAAFSIVHNMSFSGGPVPSFVQVSRRSSAGGTFYVSSVDDTNITITFDSAPASGTNNVVVAWQAAL